MSVKKVTLKSKYVAKLVTEEKGPCSFCQRDVDDEIIFGKLYAIGSIKCHYFCVLLSCCMVQKGRDEDGLFGFLYPDILAEIERSKKHKCSYCNKEGATLGCSVSQCRKQFHLPCGREKNAVSLFYGSYKSFCQNHTPKQKIADNVMAKARVRMQQDRKRMKLMRDGVIVEAHTENTDPESVCVICYEPVQAYPTIQTFWPPCCARDAWFHRTCLQRMALSAGMHYLKCPLCNDKDNFYDAVMSQGYYVPDRDAAWELEQNAFADIYERPLHCDMEECQCPMGREHDSDSGPWDIKLCLLCGSSGAHAHCLSARGAVRLLCALCRAANTDVERLADTIEAVMVTEQAQMARRAERPVMPSRMSLRRTKQRIACNNASSSRSQESATRTESETRDHISSREDLNLKPPKRAQQDRNHVIKDIQNKLHSPSKMLEQLYDKISAYDVDAKLVERVKEMFRKPKPLSVKKKIVDNLLDNILNNMTRDKSKSKKEPVKEWCSPKKSADAASDLTQEINVCSSPKRTVKSPCKSPTHTPLKILLKKSNSPKKSEENSDNKSPNKENNTPNIIENNEPISIDDDESSTSTFQLPPEFIADNSNDSLPLFDTPKLKTVDIQKDSSLEISENDEVVNVNVVKMEETSPSDDFIKNLNIKSPVKTQKCAFKFSPLDKETLEKENVGFDLESFKNRYLDEVATDFECKFNHKHSDLSEDSPRLKTAIDFAMEATNERKRSMADTEDIPKKKRRVGGTKQKKLKRSQIKKGKKIYKYKKSTDIEVSNGEENLKLSLHERKKKKNKGSKNKEIKVKIQWKKKRLQVRISEAKVKKAKKESPKLQQYVLKYKAANDTVIEKPQFHVTPIKRKYIKLEKSSDNLKQTSIQSFFKVQIPKKEATD